MGNGDWNDGMSGVGKFGKGESVWLGWFLCTVIEGMERLEQIAGTSGRYSENEYLCGEFAGIREKIRTAIESSAWDRDHYMRAFYDNGRPLGVWSDSECCIDSVSQSWSVISCCGNEKRRKEAISTALKHLADREHGVIKLLTPPFGGVSDGMSQSPGYIAAYPPGVRENGAQYTHAAIWLAKAFLMEEDSETGYELVSMINPVNHSRTLAEANVYKSEPYAVAADVLSEGKNAGRGGWTWYTGSASWLYRVILEDMLGVRRCGDVLEVNPRLPAEWRGNASVSVKVYGKIYDIDLGKGKQIIKIV